MIWAAITTAVLVSLITFLRRAEWFRATHDASESYLEEKWHRREAIEAACTQAERFEPDCRAMIIEMELAKRGYIISGRSHERLAKR